MDRESLSGGFYGERPGELNCSSLAGTCGLIYTGMILYVHVCIGSTDESQHRLSMWQHVLGACIKHSHEMEGEHDATTQQWQNGREGAAFMKDMHRRCASSTAEKKALP